MAEGKLDQLRDIARRWRAGELSLHDAALQAGMSEQQFTSAVKGYAWMEDKAGQAGRLASGAAQTGRRLWSRWANKK